MGTASILVLTPRGSEEAGSLEYDKKEYLQGVRVLIVDDHGDSRILMRRVLERNGAQVGDASSVEEAVMRLERGRFDVIATDLSMPEQDGFDLIKTLHENLERGRSAQDRTPIIAVSGHADEGSRRRSLAKGFEAHLVKPIDHEQLIEVILLLAKRNRSAPTATNIDLLPI